MTDNTEQWLMGENDDVRPSETRREEISDPEKMPYYDFCKYRVKFLKESYKETDEWNVVTMATDEWNVVTMATVLNVDLTLFKEPWL